MKADNTILVNAVISTLLEFKLFASVSAAQAILESGNGKSKLSEQPNNNFFGFKAGSTWQGPTVTLDTMEATGKEKARFRVYSSPLRSFIDRNKLLNQFSRYVPVLNAGTPQEQIQALGKSGYATDTKYSEKLLKVWQEYDLSRLDTLRPLTLSGLGLFLVFELKNKNLI